MKICINHIKKRFLLNFRGGKSKNDAKFVVLFAGSIKGANFHGFP